MIDPTTYPYHMFVWPNVDNQGYASRGQLNCDGSTYPCVAELAMPWSSDFGTAAHEIGCARRSSVGMPAGELAVELDLP